LALATGPRPYIRSVPERTCFPTAFTLLQTIPFHQLFVLGMTDSTSQKSGPTKASFLSRLNRTVLSGSSSSPTAKPRPPGIKIPPYPVSQFKHPLEFGTPSETVCTSCSAVNTHTFDNPYPQIPYVWHNSPGNHGRYPDIWCMSCKSKNSIPYPTGGPVQRQTQTARKTEQGNKESIVTFNDEEEVEPEEQPPPSYANTPHNSTDAWAENRTSFACANTGPDGLLDTEGLGSTCSLFTFANQEGKGN